MKKTYLNILYVACAVTLLTSCRARFYTPNRNPVPLFKNKGDLYIDAAGATSFSTKYKYDLTAGYAILDGLGAYVGYAGAREGTSSTSADSANTTTNFNYRGDMINMGLGYFLSQKRSEHFRFEVFADMALGNYRNIVSGGNNQFFNGNYRRIGIMPNIGYTTANNRLSVAYSIRFSNISFSNASISNKGYWNNDINRLYSKPDYNLLEHGITFRVGGEYVKFQMQAAFYHGLDSNEETNAIPTFNASLMLGVVFNMNVLKKD